MEIVSRAIHDFVAGRGLGAVRLHRRALGEVLWALFRQDTAPVH